MALQRLRVVILGAWCFLLIVLSAVPPTEARGWLRRRCETCVQTVNVPVMVTDPTCEANLASCHNTVGFLEEEAQMLEGSLAACTEETHCLSSQLHTAVAERDHLYSSVTHLQSSVDQCTATLCKAERQVKSLRKRLKECRESLAAMTHARDATQSELESVCALLKCCQQERNEVKLALEQAMAQLEELKQAKEDLRVALAVRTAWLYAIAGALALAAMFMLFSWWYFGRRIAELKTQLRECDGASHRGLDRLRELTGLYNAADARADGLQHRVTELSTELVHCRTGKAMAERDAHAAAERAMGATREMAANKKDCCCSHGASPVIHNPIITTTTPACSPNNGNPNNGNSPNNGDPNNGNDPNNANPNNSNDPNNANPNNSNDPNNANPNNSNDPNNGNPNNSNDPNNANPNNSNDPNNANPNNSNDPNNANPNNGNTPNNANPNNGNTPNNANPNNGNTPNNGNNNPIADAAAAANA